MANNVKASFDVNTKEGKMKVFNAQNGASKSLKNLPDKYEIECNGAMQYTESVDAYNKEQPQEGTISVLFGTDGNSYAGLSDTVAKAVEKLIDYIEATESETFVVQLIKQESNGGREFLNLQLVG